jgi:N-formylglutamate amidohydrolase
MQNNFDISVNKNSPIICNVPHSGVFIPEGYKKDFILNSEELTYEVKHMADNFTNILYGELLNISSYIKSNLSRLVVDIERFADEDNEPMAKVGMSAFYTKTSSGVILRNISEDNSIKLKSIYEKYHNTFTELVKDSLDIFNEVIIVDCHSFSSQVRSYESDKNQNRPDICIGADDFHTPKILVDILKSNFEELGYSVEINSPFSGTIVPLEYYKKDHKVLSVMIEVNRKLYMNERTFSKLDNFNIVASKISRTIIKSLNEYIK